MAREENKPVRKKKAKWPKVRTGCKTCKIRRVKCDEAKPICNRCVTFGVDCDGYTENIYPKAIQTSQRALMVHKPSKPSQKSPLYSTLSQTLFNSDQEYRYFQIFTLQTARGLSGHFSSTLWQTLVLQACETEPSLRHAVIALGALQFSYYPPSQFQNESSILRHQFALQEYSKAISQIRRQISATQEGVGQGAVHNIRTALIACVLFSCFEAFHGFVDQAIAQVYAGVKMIEEWLQKPNQSVSHLTYISSPHPSVIEDELLQAFARLELEAMTRQDVRSAASHITNRYFGQRSIDAMPASFTTLTEARAYLDLVGRRAMHWTASIEGKDNFNGVISVQNLGVFQEYAVKCSERNKILAEYENWARSFEPLWRLSRHEKGKVIFHGATTLRLHFLADYLCKSTVACSTEIYYGYFTRELREIVSLAKILLSTPGYPTGSDDTDTNLSYNFDIQVTLPLMTVGLKFRHRNLRRQAIDLLLGRHRRDGIWDSWVMGQTIQWLADIEDEGLCSQDEEEHVPEERVVKMVQMHHDEIGRKTTVSCLQPGFFTEEKFTQRQVVIPWL